MYAGYHVVEVSSKTSRVNSERMRLCWAIRKTWAEFVELPGQRPTFRRLCRPGCSNVYFFSSPSISFLPSEKLSARKFLILSARTRPIGKSRKAGLPMLCRITGNFRYSKCSIVDCFYRLYCLPQITFVWLEYGDWIELNWIESNWKMSTCYISSFCNSMNNIVSRFIGSIP